MIKEASEGIDPKGKLGRGLERLSGILYYFDYVGMEQRLHLKDSKAYTDGMVELTYEVVKD